MTTPSGKYGNFLYYALLLLLVWLPLPLGSNRPWAEAIFEIWSAMILLFWIAGYLRGHFLPGAAFRQAKAVLWLLVIWLIYLMLQWLPLPFSVRSILSPEGASIHALAGETGWGTLSVAPYSTFHYWLKSTAYVFIFALILLLVNSKIRLILLGYALVLSGLFQASYGSIMTLSGLEYGFFMKKIVYVGYATGTYVNRNHLAGYLEMTLAVGIGLLFATTYERSVVRSWRQRLRNWLNLASSHKLPLRLMLAAMVIGLVLTRSRMGNTAFFSSMLVAGLLTLSAFRHQTGSVAGMFRHGDTRSAVILIASLIAIDVFIVGAWFGVEKVVHRIEKTSEKYDADRISVSDDTLKLIKDYPLTGAGGGSFHLAFMRYRGAGPTVYYDHAHEDYLEITADNGAIGLALLGSSVLLSLRAALRALYRRRDGLMRGMAFSSVMGTTALLIHGTVDFNLQIPANAATFMVILSLGWIALHLDRHQGVREKVHASR